MKALKLLGRIALAIGVVAIWMFALQWWFDWPTDLTYGEIFRMYLGPGW